MPDHRWILLRKAVIHFADAMREADYRDPDNFNMYVYNDFFGYGLMEMIENFLVEYHKEFKKKQPDLKVMWVQITALGQFMNTYDMTPFSMIDDGQRQAETIGLIGSAIMSMLNALDRAGEIKDDSFFKDLGIVIGPYIAIGDTYEDSLSLLEEGEESLNDDSEDEAAGDEDEEREKLSTDWRIRLRQFAKLKNIDISVVHGAQGEDYDSLDVGNGKGPSGWPKEKTDRWKFTEKFKDHASKYATPGDTKSAKESLGGKSFDITRWSRAQRASHAFDKKDPLKDIPEKELKAGNIMLS